MIRLVAISGPRGAGKETILAALLRDIHGLRRIVPHTTRPPRPTEQDAREYHFIDEPAFERLVQEDAFVWHGRVGPSQRSGTVKSEFFTPSLGSVIDVLPEGARTMRERIREMGGRAFLMAVFAPSEDRRRRILQRHVGISEADVTRLMREDPVSPHPGEYLDFNQLLQNADSNPDTACRLAVSIVRTFLAC